MKNISLFYFTMLLGILILGWTQTSCNNDILPEPNFDLFCDSILVSYENQMKPIIDATCAIPGCHGTSSSDGDFTSYQKMQPFLNKNGLEKRIIERKDMPVDDTLSTVEFELFQCWINEGYLEN